MAGSATEDESFVACDVCAFPICRPCYEYERKDGNQSCLSAKPDTRDTKRKEKYMKIIDGLTKRRYLPKGEVENVRNYYNNLKAYNLELKSMKQKC